MDSNSKGIALLCDAHGTIIEIIYNDFTLATNLVGVSIARLVDPASVTKLLNFLGELKDTQAVFNWEINIKLEDKPESFHFAGAHIEENLLIVAAKTSVKLGSLYKEMMQIHNEQATLFRSVSKANVEMDAVKKREQDIYGQLAELNNELSNLQRELTQKNAALERLNEQKNQFLGMAAHDLRNPLWVIMSYSEFLMKPTDEPLSPQKEVMVSAIRDSSQFMLGLVNDLLDIATIESGKLRLNQEATDLNRLVSRVASLNQVLSLPKGITIHLAATEETIPTLFLDQQKLEQVLNNLLSNAVKYSQPKTSVWIAVKLVTDKVIISIKDEGQGIPPSEIDKLFKPFSVTSVRSTAGEKSTGLGLTITRRIIEGHGGQIWVESEVGNGSMFCFSLPLSLQVKDQPPPSNSTEDNKPTLEQIQNPLPPKTASLHILLAEDNKLNQKVVELTLKRIGLTVDIANNGLEVLDAMKAHHYDIILMDVNMPIMDGLEATRKIRAEWPADSQPRIIAMTGGNSPEEKNDCINAGMDEFLTKPIQFDLLKSHLGVD